jgi:adenylate kinase family enzyme
VLSDQALLSIGAVTGYLLLMTRVMVIGNAGGGKSTMCRALSSAHSLPYYAVDKIQWRPNWVLTPEPEFTQAHEALLSRERWLIDGYGSWSSVERRISVADTIIFVDHSIWVHYWWATKRQIKSLFHGRPDGPEGCPMFPVTIRLFKMMWWLHWEKRLKLIAAIEARRGKARIIHIRSPSELAAFAANPV